MMNGGPEVAVEEDTMPCPNKGCPPARQRNFNALLGVVSAVNTCLCELARLGRRGQWILHHEGLYKPTLDTRPQSRKPDEEIPIKGVTYFRAPITDRGLIWSGKGPAPDFTDITFWQGKRQELKEKIEQVKAGLVQPRFTPEELQTLDLLEQREGHFFCTALFKKKKIMANHKRRVFNSLIRLAALDRPGQWILHHEDLYHPIVDTRPQTRAAETSILIRDSTYKGDTRALGGGILYDYELTWAGTGPPPDFADFSYWENKASDLFQKTQQVKKGLVQPDFTPEELRTLEVMETDEDHLFGQCAKARRENPSGAKPEALPIELKEAMWRVRDELSTLWDNDGHPGQWVLYHEKLYIPSNDIRVRDRDGDEDEEWKHVIMPGPDGMCYDGYEPLPDFQDIMYWERKLAELQKKREEVKAGKLGHGFTQGELMRIELLEREQMNQLCGSDDENTEDKEKGTIGVEAWLDRNAKETMLTPSPPLSPTFSDHIGRAAKKRKRPAIDDDESLPGHAQRPVKRSKEQPRPDPTPTRPTQRHVSGQTRASPVQEPRSRLRTPRSASPGPSNARIKTDGHLLTGRGTQRPTTGLVRGGGSNVSRQAWRLAGVRPGAGWHPRRRCGSPTNPPLRRSARIAAMPPRHYK